MATSMTHSTPRYRHAPGLSLEGLYGPELVQHVARHLTFIAACFGFVGPGVVGPNTLVCLEP
jgi:hypothetical protein